MKLLRPPPCAKNLLIWLPSESIIKVWKKTLHRQKKDAKTTTWKWETVIVKPRLLALAWGTKIHALKSQKVDTKRGTVSGVHSLNPFRDCFLWLLSQPTGQWQGGFPAMCKGRLIYNHVSEVILERKPLKGTNLGPPLDVIKYSFLWSTKRMDYRPSLLLLRYILC